MNDNLIDTCPRCKQPETYGCSCTSQEMARYYADALTAAQARIAELEEENAKYAEHLLCLGVPKFGPRSGPSGLNDSGFRLIGSDAAVMHFQYLFKALREKGVSDEKHNTQPVPNVSNRD